MSTLMAAGLTSNVPLSGLTNTAMSGLPITVRTKSDGSLSKIYYEFAKDLRCSGIATGQNTSNAYLSTQGGGICLLSNYKLTAA